MFYSGLKYFGTGKECQPTLDGTAKKLIVTYNSIIPSPSISIEEIPFKYCRIPSMFQFHRFWWNGLYFSTKCCSIYLNENFHPGIYHGSQFNQNIVKYYFSQNYGSYQALLIVNIIRSDFAPKRAKLQEHTFGPNQTSPLDTNVHELMKLISTIRQSSFDSPRPFSTTVCNYSFATQIEIEERI